jgi:hypothetical protein
MYVRTLLFLAFLYWRVRTWFLANGTLNIFDEPFNAIGIRAIRVPVSVANVLLMRMTCHFREMFFGGPMI